MAKDPLIAVADRSPFGESTDPSTAMSFHDRTYVAGYSDKRQRKEKVPVRLHWVRAQTPSGRPDGQDIASHRMQGYNFVTSDNIASLGIEEPASGQLDAATKRYVLGDTVLMYCTREVAARNEKVLRRATEERSANDATASHLHAEGTKVGKALGQDMLTESSLKQEFTKAP